MMPKDPMILLSYINTKLRDAYGSLAELCEAYDEDPEAVKKKLAAVGFRYDEETNRFR